MSLYPPTQRAYPSLTTGAFTLDVWWRWKTAEKWATFHHLYNGGSLVFAGTALTDNLQNQLRTPLKFIMSGDTTLDSIYVSCWFNNVCIRQYSQPINESGKVGTDHTASALCPCFVRNIFPGGKRYSSKFYGPPAPVSFINGDRWTTAAKSAYATFLTAFNATFTVGGQTFVPTCYSIKHNSFPGRLPAFLAGTPTWVYRRRPRGAGHNRIPIFPVI